MARAARGDLKHGDYYEHFFSENLRKKNDFEEIITERWWAHMNDKTKIMNLCKPLFTPNSGFKSDDAATALGNSDNSLMNIRYARRAKWGILCCMAEAVVGDPKGPAAKSLDAANKALGVGNMSAQDVIWWIPTRQIKIFHPRTRCMMAYRDAEMGHCAQI
ncbi:esterase family protein [Colletotrichum musicola]|uniref:Esterase family protein n=1 Tax=Colletotrichum musicola TaxID=2175873 RepID=A0A8H6IMV3_9PEZI|nr:esterase family protein [Colletotrichum musicola]